MRDKSDVGEILVGDARVHLGNQVKTLGVHLEPGLTVESHINRISKICRYNRRNIANIRHLFTTESTYALVKSQVISKLDYCNSLFINISKDFLSKLHLSKIQQPAL